MRDDSERIMWGQVEKIGKGTKANYDPHKKALTFCFNRGPNMSGEHLRKLREQLMKELKDLGYDSHMKYNGEVIVENVTEQEVSLSKKNHKLTIHLNNKQTGEKEPSAPRT